MNKEIDEQANTVRVKVLKEFLKLSDEYGKELVSKIFAEFIVVVLPDKELREKLNQKGRK